MNIYIYNCSNTFNYGSMMMGENFIYYFNKVTATKNNYYVETTDNQNIDRLIYATGINSIYAVAMNALFEQGANKYNYILAYFGVQKVIANLASNIDLVIVLGGDDFTEDYGWKGPLLNAMKFNILKREGMKIVMLGQTMGPYHSFRIHVMKKLLGKIDKIVVRDSITYNYLKKNNLKNISITDDFALLPLPKQQFKERTKMYIMYCPSELIYRYSKEGKREDWIDFNLFMINKLMSKYIDKKLVLLAHVIKPESVDDRIIVNELYHLVEDKYKDRIIIENNEMYPYCVRNYIQQSLFTISSRMHPIISSIQCEIPIIALSYSNKYWGIIGERYELGDYIIDVRYSSYNQMKKQFVMLLGKIDNEYEKIQEKMKNKNNLATKRIEETLEEIKQL